MTTIEQTPAPGDPDRGPAARSGPGGDGYGPAGRSAWLDVDWREHVRWVRLAGRWANCVDLGDGPPILFVHGLGGCWQNWLEQLPVLAERHRVIAMDLPGFGHSEMPAETITISRYSAWLDQLCDVLGIGPTAVVGNSMGGFIGAELAVSRPERVERLALVAAAGLSIDDERRNPDLILARRTRVIVTWAAAHLDILARRPELRARALRFVFEHADRLPGPLVSEQLKGTGKPGFAGALDALTSYPIRSRIPEIACPTLIVWGTRDRLVPLRDAHEFGELIPGSRKVIFGDTGHVPMIERPARFNAALEAFLAE